MPPTPALAIGIRGPTRVEALYRAEAPSSIPTGPGAELRLVSISPSGPVSTPVPISAVYRAYYWVETAPPAQVNGTAQLWAPNGSTLVFTAPATANFGNGTRLVFKGWGNGQTNNFTAIVTGPMHITPIYTAEYLVSVEVPDNVTEVWEPAGSAVVIKAPGVISLSNGTRLIFEGWSINGKAVNSTTAIVRVSGPTSALAQYRREHLVRFYSQYGQPQPASAWAAAGQPIYASVQPELVWRYVFWRFDGWMGPDGRLYQPPVPAMPGQYIAVWSLDILHTAALYGLAMAAIASAAWYIKRRRGGE
jgi:hypothetical protein